MGTKRLVFCGAALLAMSVISVPAYATVAIETVAAAGSYLPAGGAIYKGGDILEKGSGWKAFGGFLLAAGGLILAGADPTDGTFYNGSFTIHYPSDLLGVFKSGWLGPWGLDPGQPAYPDDPSKWGDVFDVALQQPNAALSATFNDTVPGELQVSFDWGNAGHAVTNPGPFMFYATAFTGKQNVQFTYLGEFPNASPPAGANFYMSMSSMNCSPPGLDTIGSCGEATTSYFRAVMVPEPSIWSILLLSLVAFGAKVLRGRSEL